MARLPKKILFAAGGTGGHLFPAQALAEQIMQENRNVDLLFAGSGLSTNPYFDKNKFAYSDIVSMTPYGGGMRKVFKSLRALYCGLRASLRLFSRERPDLIIGFGSFHVFPLLCAAVIRKTPFILFESNALPGKVVRLFSRKALFSGIFFSAAKNHLKGKTIEVEIPIKGLRNRSNIRKEDAKMVLGLTPDVSTLLVFGGSQGAKKINQTIIELLPKLQQAKIQIQLIHFTGSEEVAQEVSRLCCTLGIPHYVKKFEAKMDIAWSAADIVMCRSGAMTLSELLHYEVPGILIPFAAASDQHQLKNALFVEQQIGGALHFLESAIPSDCLMETLFTLTAPDSPQRRAMQESIQRFMAQQKKDDLGRLIQKFINSNGTISMQAQYHFIGIGGIGMSALARILLQKGIKVSGSDIVQSHVTEQLQQLGADIRTGHSSSHLSAASTVIYGTAITESNPEIKSAKEQDLHILHRSELLDRMMQGSLSLLVAGAHGKTTVSALWTHLLCHAGLDPTYAIGGIAHDLHSNGGLGKGSYFVAEADESDGSFLLYSPFGAIVTNINNDHLDYWKTFEHVVEGFKQFLSRVRSSQHLMWCGDDEVLRLLNPPGFSYGFSETNDLHIQNFRQEGWKNIFDLSFEGASYTEIVLPLIGAHNVLNAAAVFGMGIKMNLSEETIRKAFTSFHGVSRRAEFKGEQNHVTVFDDYGHHPAEIFATLRAFKQAVGMRRLVVAFQPHRFSRTRDCLHEFGPAFARADLLVLTDIYSAGELPIRGVTNTALLAAIQHHATLNVCYAPRDALPTFLASCLNPSDVLVTMGAGDITYVGPAVLKVLQHAQETK